MKHGYILTSGLTSTTGWLAAFCGQFDLGLALCAAGALAAVVAIACRRNELYAEKHGI